jgi:hypothetical protein
MDDMSDLTCVCCGEPLERVRYFPRQLLMADDMRAEQEYFRERARRHNRYLHGWGVVCGCTVEVVEDAKSPTVRVCPGYAVGPQGDEICIDCCIDVDLKTGASAQPCSVRWPCPPIGAVPAVRDSQATVYIAVRYAECFSRPVRVHPAGCGCDEIGCEYSRVRGTSPNRTSRRRTTTTPGARQCARRPSNCSSACIPFRCRRVRSATAIRGWCSQPSLSRPTSIPHPASRTP